MAITPQQAYDICSAKYGPLKCDKFSKIKNYYVISPAQPGDFSSEAYKIEVDTGVITEFDFIEDYKRFSEEELDSCTYYRVINGVVR